MAKKSKEKKPSERRPTEKDILNKKRLELEIKELAWNVALMGKLVKLAPLFTPLMLAVSILASVYWYTKQWNLQIEQQRLETERQRQETITNLKRELAGENLSIRIAAIQALAGYPKEAIPVLISYLEIVDPLTKEKDVTFTIAVKNALEQIGKDATVSLIKELKRLQTEIISISPELRVLIGGAISFSCQDLLIGLEYSFYSLLNEPLEDISNKLKKILCENGTIEIDDVDKNVGKIIGEINRLRLLNPELKMAYRNILEVLAGILRYNDAVHLDISNIDLSGSDLQFAQLSGAHLEEANLSHTILDYAGLSHADLTDAYIIKSSLKGTNLLGANLGGACLLGCDLEYADISEADLNCADLSFANLTDIKGFKEIKDLEQTSLKGVKGLSKEDLEYAKSKGAIIE